MTIQEAVRVLDESIPDRTRGLPDEVFYFISRVTPLVNVDLLVKDKNGRTLLSWRDDEYCGRGWHIPGSIVRYKETFEERIHRTAERELGVRVTFDSQPLQVEQLIKRHYQNRAHFISFLYRCSVPDGYEPQNKGKKSDDPGFLQWHDFCPENLLDLQSCYRYHIDN
jgi:colanic acid biosynthesis protein WcaH